MGAAKLKDSITIKGRLQIKLNGVTVVDDENMVVASGKEWAAKMLGGIGKTVNRMKVGNNGGQPNELQTDLLSAFDPDTGNPPAGGEFEWIPLTNPGGDVYVNTIEFIATAQPGVATFAIKECGLFSQLDEMVARKAFGEVNKGPSDIMSFIWTLTVI